MSVTPVRCELPVDMLVASEANPNKMTEREFDLLVENMSMVGHTDAVLVWPFDIKLFKKVWNVHKKALGAEPEQSALNTFFDDLRNNACAFRIVGGHHRTEAAKYAGKESVPCTVIVDTAFNEEQAEIQLMRHNAIKGKLDPQKFFNLYEKYLTKGYDQEMVQDLFGFADEAEFKKLIEQTAKTLPKDLQQKFKEAAAEIKTIDGLAKLLNQMFTTYGDTLPHGYMVIDYGGQASIWLRVSQKTFDAINLIGQACMENSRTMDDMVGGILQSIAKGEAPELIQAALDKTKPIKIPSGLMTLPTADAISKVESLGG